MPEAQPQEFTESRREARRRHRHSGPPTIQEGISQTFFGVGFLVLAIALALFGGGMGANTWWFWMLIPAFIFIGKGIGQIVQVKQQSKTLPPASASLSAARPTFSSPQHVSALPPRSTSELVPTPPSVTEGTTRHLGGEAPTRYLDPDQEEH
jgi:hypothetical protein